MIKYTFCENTSFFSLYLELKTVKDFSDKLERKTTMGLSLESFLSFFLQKMAN